MEFMGRLSFTMVIATLLFFCLTQAQPERVELQNIVSVQDASIVPSSNSGSM